MASAALAFLIWYLEEEEEEEDAGRSRPEKSPRILIHSLFWAPKKKSANPPRFLLSTYLGGKCRPSAIADRPRLLEIGILRKNETFFFENNINIIVLY